MEAFRTPATSWVAPPSNISHARNAHQAYLSADFPKRAAARAANLGEEWPHVGGRRRRSERSDASRPHLKITIRRAVAIYGRKFKNGSGPPSRGRNIPS